MKKVDFKKELKDLYDISTKEVKILTIPKMNYLMIDGMGDPNTSEEYKNAVQALFGMSYTIKFMIKKSEQGIDYGVLPLEGLWWVDDMRDFSVDKKEDWKWTSMIMQPEFVTEEMFEKAKSEVAKKKDLPSLGKVRFNSYDEGLCAQVLHLGPFSGEGPTIERLHGHITDTGYKRSGKHHEIYISDFRKTAPEKLKTIIRQPMAP